MLLLYLLYYKMPGHTKLSFASLCFFHTFSDFTHSQIKMSKCQTVLAVGKSYWQLTSHTERTEVSQLSVEASRVNVISQIN